MKQILFVFIVAGFVGCAAPGHLNTPSGTPEVTVHATAQAAQKECMRWLLANGFEVGNPPDATRQIVSFSGHQFTDYGNTNTWINFNYFSADSTTTTIYAKKVIWYKSSGNKPQTSQADYVELQNDLDAIAQNLGSKEYTPSSPSSSH